MCATSQEAHTNWDGGSTTDGLLRLQSEGDHKIKDTHRHDIN